MGPRSGYGFFFGEEKNPFHLSGFEPQDYASILISDDNLVFLIGPSNANLQRGTGHFTLHNYVFPSEAKCTLFLCANNYNVGLGAKSWPVSKASDISTSFRRPRFKITKILFQIPSLFGPTLIAGNQILFTVGSSCGEPRGSNDTKTFVPLTASQSGRPI